MKRLILIRHAKSDWSTGVRDIDRPLNARGVNATALIGPELKLLLTAQPDAIFSSTANRASTTARRIVPYLGIKPESVHFQERLYTFSSFELQETLEGMNDELDSIMIFGHNHAITDLANFLGSIAFDNVPTCGVVCIDMDTNSWKDLKRGETIFNLFPRDLK